MNKRKLSKKFYARPCVQVAQDLLGKILVFRGFQGIITETEAYRGSDDPASHAFKGPTPRSAIMFGSPGISYVYLIYGVYHCLNIVTEEEGQASAVLIRGLQLSDRHLDGPGKICQHLGISKTQQGINLITSDQLYVTEGVKSVHYQATPRVGIKKAIDKPWRFVMQNIAEVIF